jgi:hypothetical protein
VPDQGWTLWRTEKILTPARKSNQDCSAIQPVVYAVLYYWEIKTTDVYHPRVL